MVLYMSADENGAKKEVQKTWRLSSAGRASALQAEGRGFEPLSLHHFFIADLAQLAEQLICNQ